MVFLVLVFVDASVRSRTYQVEKKNNSPAGTTCFSLKEHQNHHSLPLIMPVILPSYGERASEMLITQLTKNYKATVMLSDVSVFDCFNLLNVKSTLTLKKE